MSAPTFRFTPAENAFRQGVRVFAREERAEIFDCEHGDLGYGFGAWSSRYLRCLGENGWLGLIWPTVVGGRGLSVRELLILFQKLAYRRVPAEALIYTQAVSYSVLKFGSDQLKAELVRGS